MKSQYVLNAKNGNLVMTAVATIVVVRMTAVATIVVVRVTVTSALETLRLEALNAQFADTAIALNVQSADTVTARSDLVAKVTARSAKASAQPAQCVTAMPRVHSVIAHLERVLVIASSVRTVTAKVWSVYDVLLADLDGVVYEGTSAIENAPEAIRTLFDAIEDLLDELRLKREQRRGA